MVDRHGRPVPDERRAGARSPSLVVVPAMTVADAVVPQASDRGYTLVRERIADVLADLQESLSGIRIIAALQPQPAQRGRSTATSSATYRDANDYTARVSAIYGPGTEPSAPLGQAVVLLDRRPHGARTARCTIGELRRSSSTSTPSSRRSSSSCSSTTPTSGPGRGRQAARAARDRARACPSGRTPSSCRRSRARSRSTT